VELNQEFLIETFYSYCKRPLHKRYQNVYNAECPVCKEGKSSGRSRRLFYFPSKQYFFCHNCSKSWQPFEWVKEVTSLTVPEILKRNREKSGEITIYKKPELIKQVVINDLPEDSIDLTDPTQVEFYKDNKFVKIALQYIESRKLLTAINTCKKFYISLTDKIHKNRLVIPFINDNKTVCYQTRALTQNQFPKYLTKFGEKELFGLSNIDSSIPYVFVFEGPIDSMFIKNGVALAALSPTEKQAQQLSNLIGYQQIYVIDNDKNNKQTSRKVDKFIKEGKTVFVWPKDLIRFKDFNEICTELELNEISWKFVVSNSFKGQQALLKRRLI
jgi:hypothetical protein